MQPKISCGDKVRLNECLESVRDIETRIDRASKEERLKGWRPTLRQPNMPRPSDEIPQDVPAHLKLMLDLTVLSQMNFKFLEGVRGALHLDLTHNGRAPLLEAMYLKTNQFHIQQFAYLVKRLKEIDEGGQSLLDSSLLMLASSLFDGDTHGADQLPIVLAGQADGALKTGRILDYTDKGNENRRACSLYLSLNLETAVESHQTSASD